MDITLSAAIIRGAFFYHHDKSVLWFSFGPVCLTGFIVCLARKRPRAQEEKQKPNALSHVAQVVAVFCQSS